MISINTGDVILDGAVSALVRKCRIPENFSVSICSDTTPCDAAADHVIVITSSEDYIKSSRHREYSALYKDNYHVLLRPLSISAFEEILDSVLSVKSQAAPKSFKKLKYNSVSKQVSVGDSSVTLSEKEAELFEYLLSNEGRTISREELRRNIWPETSGTNAPDVYVTYLRRKLKSVLGDGALVNVRGEGYLLKY